MGSDRRYGACWGRNEEAYGEDPVLTGKLASALVQGIQGDHPFYVRAVASLKHFLGNNNEIDRGECSVSIDPRNMREYYLKAFELPFKEGGALSMMTSYNAVNGIPANLNKQVRDMVKGEWGMPGFVVSDAGDVLSTVNDHRYCESYAEAVAGSIRAGIDSITDDHTVSKQAIHDALASGLLTESDLDTALHNTFRVRMRLGEFDPQERNPYAAIDESIICAPEHREISREAAGKGIVLLKNAGRTLPLQADQIGKVAVIGPMAGIVYRDWYSGDLPYTVSPLEAIVAKLGEARVNYASGNDTLKLRLPNDPAASGTAPADYLGWDDRGNLAAIRGTADAEQLERTDWGWGANTFVPNSRPGRYLTTEGDTYVRGDAKEIFGWFTKEVFLVEEYQDAELTLASWNGGIVSADADGVLRVGDGGAAKDIHGKQTGADPDCDDGDGDGQRSLPKFAKLKTETIRDGLQEAIDAARNTDAAIVFVGNHPLINGKETIDRPGLNLPASQEQLVREVLAVNPNTIVVIVGSYPFAIPWLDEHVPAIVYSSHAGPELGNALADVLFGDEAPAGRLSMTWYRSEEQLPPFMDYDIIKQDRTYQYFGGEALYPFGHGLTYATFSYGAPELSSTETAADSSVTITVQVRNTGSYASDEVVQVYTDYSQLKSRVKRPLRQLLAFRRIQLAAGQSADVSFDLRADELAFWDVTRARFCVEAGTYRLLVGRSSANIASSAEWRIRGETIPPRNLSLNTDAISYDDYEGVYIDENKEGGSCVAVSRDTAWIQFHEVDLGGHPQLYSKIKLRVLSLAEGSVDIRIGGAEGILAGKVLIPRAGSEPSWATFEGEVSLPSGIQDLTLVLNGDIRLSSFHLCT